MPARLHVATLTLYECFTIGVHSLPHTLPISLSLLTVYHMETGGKTAERFIYFKRDLLDVAVLLPATSKGVDIDGKNNP